jgi:tyrosyl-tRNA synthetase
MDNVFDVLKERGFIYQCTDENEVKKMLSEKSITLYLGFDATATSLHVGSLLGLMALSWFQKYGHQVITLIGGGTTMIGDPSDKDEMRKMLREEDIYHNGEAIRKQIEKYVKFDKENLDSENQKPAIMVNNYDWLKPLSYLEVLREVGPYISINEMVARESVKRRMEKGLTFLEFNYSILQAYDYYYLNQKYNCQLQVGGSDQWGNIISGYDLIRKKTQNIVDALTWPLMSTSTGQKMGKTVGGAIWISEELLAPYDYYQFWINTTDDDVEKFLALYTYLPMEEVRRLGKLSGSEIRKAKEVLAYEATSITHGRETADKVKQISEETFKKGNVFEADLPTYVMNYDRVKEGLQILDLFVESGLTSSKGEARRLIKQGGAYLNEEKVNDMHQTVTENDIQNEVLVLRSGKKKYMKVIFN